MAERSSQKSSDLRKNLTTNGHESRSRGTNQAGAEQKTTDLKLARLPPRSPLPVTALPSMSLIPAAPFHHEDHRDHEEKKSNPQITQINTDFLEAINRTNLRKSAKSVDDLCVLRVLCGS